MNKYSHIAARALNRPLLLEPGYASIFFAALGDRLSIDSLHATNGQILSANELPALAASYQSKAVQGRMYSVKNGVAIIPLDGTLVHKSGYVGSSSGTMGYDGVAAQLQTAIADPEVQGILLDVDSPGGEVAGVQALANSLANSPKPVWAHANETAASAAYWLASASSKLVLSGTAAVGSIGVLVAHADFSKKLASDGISVTLIHAGAHKVDGNPYEALPEAVRASIQSDIDSLRTLFASSVSANRKISIAQVMGTEARMFRGQDAVNQGLADAVMSFDETLFLFSQTLTSTSRKMKGSSMSVNSSASPASGEANAAIDAARAEGMTQGLAQGRTEGATAERARISAILSHENATGREATAREFALGTDMAADQAVRLLASVPQVSKVSATLEQMSQTAAVAPGAHGGETSTLAQRVAALRK